MSAAAPPTLLCYRRNIRSEHPTRSAPVKTSLPCHTGTAALNRVTPMPLKKQNTHHAQPAVNREPYIIKSGSLRGQNCKLLQRFSLRNFHINQNTLAVRRSHDAALTHPEPEAFIPALNLASIANPFVLRVSGLKFWNRSCEGLLLLRELLGSGVSTDDSPPQNPIPDNFQALYSVFGVPHFQEDSNVPEP